MNKVEIAVVTHPKSKHPVSVWMQTQTFFASFFRNLVVQVDCSASNENLYGDILVPIHTLYLSKRANKSLARRWHHKKLKKTKKTTYLKLFLKDEIRSLLDLIQMLLNKKVRLSETAIYVRSVNISLSHVSIIRSAYENDNSLLLILEDDAIVDGSNFDSDELENFLESAFAFSGIPCLINLSKSLTWKQLQLEDMHNSKLYLNFSPNIYLPTFQFHNTTCANIYNSAYIEKFSTRWAKFVAKSTRRGIPFDWIINAIILKFPNDFLRTFHMHQPIVIQGSMHS